MTTRKVYGQRLLTAQVNQDRWTVGQVDLADRDPGECPRLHGDDGPCPYVGCKHHLWSDVTDDGSLRVYHPYTDVEDLPETCSLDCGGRGTMALEDIAEVFGVTRERIRQILQTAVEKMAAVGGTAWETAREEMEEGERVGGYLQSGRVDGNSLRGDRRTGEAALVFPEKFVTARKTREQIEAEGLDVVGEYDEDGSAIVRINTADWLPPSSKRDQFEMEGVEVGVQSRRQRRVLAPATKGRDCEQSELFDA